MEPPQTAAPGNSPLSVPTIDVIKMMDPPTPASFILFPIAMLKRHAHLKLLLKAASICCTLVSKNGSNSPNKIPPTS